MKNFLPAVRGAAADTTRAHRRRNLGLLALAALLLAAAAALVGLRPAGATSAAPALRAVLVSCGQTITANTVVSNDLTNCPHHGLVIGADGITLDLGGHTIDGNSSGTGHGVLSDGFDNVKIQDGTLRDFSHGLMITGHADGNRVANVRAYHNFAGGIHVLESDEAAIAGSTSVGNVGPGIEFEKSDGGRVTNSTANGNLLDGVRATAANELSIAGTTTVSNGANGLSVGAGSLGVEISASVASSNDLDGVRVLEPTAKVKNSTTLFNTQLGINAVAGVTDGGGNKAHGNGSLHQCENVACG
jgi:parallel beta-helix repeat protein